MAESTISSRVFSQLFWSRKDKNFDLNADFTFDEEKGEVDALHTIPGFYEGAPSKVHGGILAAVLDECQGALCYHLGHFVMTDQLNMSYRKATPVDTELRVRAWITAARKKKLYTQALIEDAQSGETYVTSHARWYLFPLKVLNRFMTYPEDDWRRMTEIMQANRKRGRGIRLNYRKNPDLLKEPRL